MFFMVGGIGSKLKEIGSCHNIICSVCGRMTRFVLYRRYDYFHLFFIPLFRWNVSYLAESACCHAWFSLPLEKGSAFEKNPDFVFTAEDFTPLSGSFGPSPLCPHCRRTIQGEFFYCPYCGKPL